MTPLVRAQALLEHAGYDETSWSIVRLIEIDSLLVTELLTLVEDVEGRPVSPATFDPLDTTLSDVLNFIVRG